MATRRCPMAHPEQRGLVGDRGVQLFEAHRAPSGRPPSRPSAAGDRAGTRDRRGGRPRHPRRSTPARPPAPVPRTVRSRRVPTGGPQRRRPRRRGRGAPGWWARIRSFGWLAARIRSTRCAISSATCSQLSSTSSASRRAIQRTASSGRPRSMITSSAPATASDTSPPTSSAASSTM